MPSQSSGPLTTFLMLVPLVAVPALAIFGVPEFSKFGALAQSAAAGPGSTTANDPAQLLEQSTDDLVSPVRNDIRRFDEPSSYETAVREPVDPQNGSFQHNVSTTQPQSAIAGGDAVANVEPQLGDESPFKEVDDTEAAGANESSKDVPAPAAKPEHDGDALTWRAAIQRLNDLGVRDFALQPGDESGEFFFTCTYSVPDQPRVVRRFEAEDAEPLLAVRKVLAQVESTTRGESSK